jgi:protease IV
MREFLNRVWDIKIPLLILYVALLVGIGLSFFIPQPVVGVITLNDAIYDYSAQYLIEQIVYAEQSPEVMAVVLVMNSPGGTVVDTEAIYLELARLRSTKPVVTVISGMAASGGYYLASGTDYIIAKPSSQVGNIGVIGYLPPEPQVFEEIYSTGPYKLWGSPQDTVVREIEMLKQGFFEAVKMGRSDALEMTDAEVLRGQIYMGSEALRKGLIDELGGETRAYEVAGNMARISNYSVEDLSELAGLQVNDPNSFYSQSPEGRTTVYPKDAGIYLLYIPPSER